MLDNIKIDDNHLNLIYGLITSAKPKNCLELGIGSGITTQTIINGFRYNQLPLDIDCVDNFFDWDGVCPEHISKYIGDVNIVSQSEQDFLIECQKKYDFIISDADHYNTHLWVERTLNLLSPKGFLIYHDVTNSSFPNLYTIIEQIKFYNLSHMIFNQSSLNSERCERGLLVVCNSRNDA